jgi:hypothetical protein
MTAEPNDGARDAAKREIRAPSAPNTPPPPTDLEARIKARRRELSDRLVELKFDTHVEAAEARDTLKAKISELAHLMKQGVADGWAAISELAKQKLERWLAETREASERRQS